MRRSNMKKTEAASSGKNLNLWISVRKRRSNECSLWYNPSTECVIVLLYRPARVFWSGTDLISLLILLLWFFWCCSLQKSLGSRIVVWSDVIFSRWRPWRHFTKQSDAGWRIDTHICPAPMQQVHVSSWSLVHSYLLKIKKLKVLYSC